MDEPTVSKILIEDAFFAINHLFPLDNQPSNLLIHLELRFCPFTRFRIVAAISNASNEKFPPLKLNFLIVSPPTQDNDEIDTDELVSTSFSSIFDADIAPGTCMTQSLSYRIFEIPIVVTVSVGLYHRYFNVDEAEKMLNEEFLVQCFTAFDLFLNREEVDEIVEIDDSYDICDDKSLMPSTSLSFKIGAQTAVDISEIAFNELTAAQIHKCLFPTIPISTPICSGFIVIDHTFHRIFIEVQKIAVWTSDAAFEIFLSATFGTNQSILKDLKSQLENKINILMLNSPPKDAKPVILKALKATFDDCAAKRLPREFDEPYADE